MKLVRPSCNPSSPLGTGEVDRENCDCECEENHCEEYCEDCKRRARRGVSGPCDACAFGECSCADSCEHDYCTCEGEEGLYEYGKDVLKVFSAYVINETEEVLLGAEVELEIPDNISTIKAHEALESAFEAAPHFIGKRDGSLDDGIEMVTLPLTLEQHEAVATAVEKHWFPVMEKTEKCGMHVHIGKASFSGDAHMERFANVFSSHGGNEEWNSFLDNLFRRRQNDYCERKENASELRDHGKYGSVNFSKQHTLEVRGFYTTTSKKVYMANIETVKAVRDATLEENTENWIPQDFIEYVTSRPESYPYLATRLQLTRFTPFAQAEMKDEDLVCA